MRFRKKPVEIEAKQLTKETLWEIFDWVEAESKFGGVKEWDVDDDGVTLIIKTLEGHHIASDGDWVIKGVKGEFYPCKHDIFEMTYERVD